MRVLMLSKACIVGIYQRKLEYIAKYPDIELKVLVPPAWKDERGITKLERVYTDGYDLQVTPIRFNGNFHLHYYPEFDQEVKNFQPDIVHIDEEPYNLATYLALRSTRRAKAKTLFFSWQNIKRDYPYPFRWLEKHVLKNIDFGLMGTQSAADVWIEKGYKGPWAVVPQFGVDIELFKPAPHKQKDNQLHIGYAGRLVEEKGIVVLLKALEGLSTKNWQLHIIGGGPEQAYLRQQVTAMGMQSQVVFDGLVPSVQMPERFQEMDILVVPSRTRPNWKEQYGRVILEAMASGVAVIGSNSGAIPDVIGDAGLIFPEDDVQALSACLDRLINNRLERENFARQGRQRVENYFTQEQVANQTVEVYRRLV